MVIMTGIAILSVGTTAVTVAFSDRATTLDTWPLCSLRPTFDSATNYVITSLNGFVFVAGVVVFAVCNAAIIRLLWTYHARRENFVLKEISKVVGTSKKTALAPNKQATSNSKRGLYKHDDLREHNGANKNDVNIVAQANEREPNTPSTDLFVDMKAKETVEMDYCDGGILGKEADGHLKNTITGSHGDTFGKTPGYLPPGGPQHSGRITVVSGKTNLGAVDIHQSEVTTANIPVPCTTEQFERRFSKQADAVVCQNSHRLPADTGSRRSSESDLHDMRRWFNHIKYNTNIAADISHKEPSPDNIHSNTVTTMTNNPTTTTSDNEHTDTHQNEHLPAFPNAIDTSKHETDARLCNVVNGANSVVENASQRTTSGSVRTNKSDDHNALHPAPQQERLSDEQKGRCCARSRSVQLTYVQRQLGKLLKKVRKSVQKQRREILLARMVMMCSVVFLLTWIPYVVS